MVPRLWPSDDFALSPTNLLVSTGIAAFFSAGDVEGAACGAAEGAVASGFVAPGGLVGAGDGACVCAIAVTIGTAKRPPATPRTRATLVTDIHVSFAA